AVTIGLATGASVVEIGGRLARYVGDKIGERADGRWEWVTQLLRRRAEPTRGVLAPPRNRTIDLEDVVEDDTGFKAPSIIREVQKRPERRGRKNEDQLEIFKDDTYRLPALSLLDPAEQTVQPLDEQTLIASSRILENKLADFEVHGKVVAVR